MRCSGLLRRTSRSTYPTGWSGACSMDTSSTLTPASPAAAEQPGQLARAVRQDDADPRPDRAWGAGLAGQQRPARGRR